MRAAFALAALLAVAPHLRADFVVVANLGPKPVTFTISHPTADGAGRQTYTLRPLENRAVPAGREPEIAFTLAGKATRYRLDPYASYLFAVAEGKPIFQGVELAGKLPPPADVPMLPPAREPFAVPVALYADQFEARNRATWGKAYAARLAAVSAATEGQAGLRLTAAGGGEWNADSRDDLFAALREFEKEAKAADGGLAFGYLSRTPAAAKPDAPADAFLSASRGAFGTHVLFGDKAGLTEAERQEVMLQELGLWLGAGHTKDPYSVMRQKLADGAANRAGFLLQFDPVNLVVVNIWAKYRRGGKLQSWADFSAPDRARLEALYKTLVTICPDSPLAADHLATLERLRDRGAVAADAGMNKPVKPREVEPAAPLAPPADAKPEATTPAEAVHAVVAAVRERAKAISGTPVGQRPRGDRLTEDLVRAAATAALKLDGPRRTGAFTTALGIALDDSTTLRKNPLTRDLCLAAETDAERKARVDALGTPTLGGRRDLCQHFALSATLAELFGPAAAEAAGVTKELADMQGTSGFSFVDLSADLAGVELAKQLKANPDKLAEVAQFFSTADYTPDATGLREGLSPKRFADDFGGVADARFKAALADIRQRVAACRGLRETPKK